MVIVATFAKVTKITLNNIHLQDHTTGAELEGRLVSGNVFDLKEGDSGLFVGHLLSSGVIQLKRTDKRTLLTPLQEKDLFEHSGKSTLGEVIANPFTDLFIQFKDQLYKDSYAEQFARARRSTENLEPPTETPSIIPAED